MRRHPTLTETFHRVTEWHGDQQYGNKPYFFHLTEVMVRAVDLFGDRPLLSHTALLHDAIEDTHVDEDFLRRLGYDDAIVDAVALLSRPDDLTYSEYIDGLIASNDKLAMMVKLADNQTNLSACLSEPDRKPGMHRRYEKSIKKLNAALETSD